MLLGLLQVMPDNIGPWSKEVLGKEMTKEEFLADPVKLKRTVGSGQSYVEYYNEYILAW